jgi:GGDEF domain-containing protein
VISFANMTKTISLSIGVSVFPDDGDTIDKLMAKADSEMYLRKKSVLD